LACLGLFLGPVVLLGGCGESGAPVSSDQPAPKNQMEGLDRIRQANIKYNQTAPPKQRSRATN
jgi:hypothetical protein